MTTRGEVLRSQMQEILKQAVIQMEGVRETVIRTVVERLDVDMDALRSKRNAVLRRLGKQSARLVQQEKVPLPAMLRQTLGKVNHLLDQWLEAPHVSPSNGGSQAVEEVDGVVEAEANREPGSDAAKAAVKTKSKRPARTSRGAGASKGGRSNAARKSRRQAETHQS